MSSKNTITAYRADTVNFDVVPVLVSDIDDKFVYDEGQPRAKDGERYSYWKSELEAWRFMGQILDGLVGKLHEESVRLSERATLFTKMRAEVRNKENQCVGW